MHHFLLFLPVTSHILYQWFPLPVSAISPPVLLLRKYIRFLFLPAYAILLLQAPLQTPVHKERV